MHRRLLCTNSVTDALLCVDVGGVTQLLYAAEVPKNPFGPAPGVTAVASYYS